MLHIFAVLLLTPFNFSPKKNIEKEMHVGHTVKIQFKYVNNNDEKKSVCTIFSTSQHIQYTTCLGYVLQRIYPLISLC